MFCSDIILKISVTLGIYSGWRSMIWSLFFPTMEWSTLHWPLHANNAHCGDLICAYIFSCNINTNQAEHLSLFSSFNNPEWYCNSPHISQKIIELMRLLLVSIVLCSKSNHVCRKMSINLEDSNTWCAAEDAKMPIISSTAGFWMIILVLLICIIII